MKLALFDLDHTLLSGDSDVLWCEFLMQQGLLDRAEFEPRNADGEVSEFLMLDVEALVERIAGGEMTVEAGLVAADFVRRRGLMPA